MRCVDSTEARNWKAGFNAQSTMTVIAGFEERYLMESQTRVKPETET